MKTHFATPERSSDAQLQQEIRFINGNTFVNGLLHSVSGLLAVLNEHRQILALNESLLELLAVGGDAHAILGLRLGEAIQCIHSCEMPGGCGTSEFCATCGAAIALVTGLATGNPVEKSCAITVDRNGKLQDLFFRVRCVPVTYVERNLLLLFIQDITYQQKLASLERLFFHDLNGLVQGIVWASDMACKKAPGEVGDLCQILHRLSQRLAGEVAMQQRLLQSKSDSYQLSLSVLSLKQVFADCRDIFANHPAARNKLLRLPADIPDLSIRTDASLLLRVLTNMIVNAFEASEEGDEVRVSVELANLHVVFSVWNRQPVPEDCAKRIFQRNFSTKPEMGRGLGTYSMKLFGEEVLGGSVSFTTSEQDGTLFIFRLPLG
ncbi:MAG: sensor histidine kinase [Geobacteraceae bacterium]|nr:sensor histidine kinase [Geobacteraceae bacterium]